MPCLECKPLESSVGIRTTRVSHQSSEHDKPLTKRNLQPHARQKFDKHVPFKHKHVRNTYFKIRQFYFEQQLNLANNTQIPDKELKKRNNLAFFRYFDDYMADIELASGLKVPEFQKELLKNYVRTHEIEFMSQADRNRARKHYNNIKTTLIEEWQKNNKSKWPYTGSAPEYYNGKLISNKPTRYQLHHIILLSYGGPNVWWNIHPAPPIKHQEIIHGERSASKKIFV